MKHLRINHQDKVITVKIKPPHTERNKFKTTSIIEGCRYAVFRYLDIVEMISSSS